MPILTVVYACFWNSSLALELVDGKKEERKLAALSKKTFSWKNKFSQENLRIWIFATVIGF